MSIWNNLKGWIQRSGVSLASPAAYELLVGANVNRAGVAINSTSVFGIPGFYNGTRRLADRIAKTDLPVYYLGPNNSTELASYHPAYNVLNKQGNQYNVAFIVKRQWIQDCIVAGNGYLFISKNGMGEVEQVYNLSADRTFPVLQWVDMQDKPTLPTLFYQTQIGPKTYWLDPSEILHIRQLGWTQSMGLQGMPLTGLMKDALGVAAAELAHSASYMRNNGAVLTHYKLQAGTTKEQLEAFKAHINEDRTGADNAGKDLFTLNNVEVTRYTMSNEDMAFIDGRKFSLIDIANILGVNPRWIGAEQNQGYGAIDSDNTHDLDVVFDPWLVQIEQELFSKLLTEKEKNSGKYEIKFSRSTLTRGDQDKFEARLNNQLALGGISWEEWRQQMNLSTVKDPNQSWRLPPGVLLEGEDKLEDTIDDPALEETETPQQETQEDNKDALRSIVTATVNRLIERMKKDKDYYPERHKEIFDSALPGCQRSISKFWEALDEEMANVLREQRPEVINSLNGNQLIKDCTMELNGSLL